MQSVYVKKPVESRRTWMDSFVAREISGGFKDVVEGARHGFPTTTTTMLLTAVPARVLRDRAAA